MGIIKDVKITNADGILGVGAKRTDDTISKKVTPQAEIVDTEIYNEEDFYSRISSNESSAMNEDFMDSEKIYRDAFIGELSFIDKGNGIYLISNGDSALGFTNVEGKEAYEASLSQKENGSSNNTPTKERQDGYYYDNWDTNYEYGQKIETAAERRQKAIHTATENIFNHDDPYVSAMRKQGEPNDIIPGASYDNWDTMYRYANDGRKFSIQRTEDGLYEIYVGNKLVAKATEDGLAYYGLAKDGSTIPASSSKLGSQVSTDKKGHNYIKVTVDGEHPTVESIMEETGISLEALTEYNKKKFRNLSLVNEGDTLKVPIDIDYIAKLEQAYVDNGTAYRGSKITRTSKKYEDYSQDELELIYAIVRQEAGDNYESALAVITCACNRAETSKWQYLGKDPLKQLKADGQFCYSNDSYWKKFLGNKVSDNIRYAVEDALNGARNHEYLSFRSYNDGAKSRERIGGNGEYEYNYYFNHM